MSLVAPLCFELRTKYVACHEANVSGFYRSIYDRDNKIHVAFLD